MKRNVLSLGLFLMIGLAASAQTEKGNWLVGGNLSLNTASKNTDIGVNPSAGYFFARNFAAGVNAGINYSKVNTTKVTTFGIGPFARYYFGTLNVRPFALGEFSLGTNKTKTTVTYTENSSNYFLGGGLAAFINRNVAVEGIAGYKHTKFEGGDGTGGFNLRIGFQVYLSKAQVESLKR